MKGRLLVATPGLVDPNFDRTVILVLDHADAGAVGIVLNRPSELDLAEPLPTWSTLASAPTVVFVGGPVAPSAAIALGRGETDVDGWTPVFPGIGVVDVRRAPEAYDGTVDEVRLFAGYAGWGPGQLDHEITSGAWFVMAPEVDDVISDAPEHLWSEVLRRAEDAGELFAQQAPQPWLN